jgi:hypothetical protein
LIHIIGVLLIRPFYIHTETSSHFAGGVIDFVLIGINAALLFLISWYFKRRACARNDAAPSNKSLDASGGSVFRIVTGPAMLG